MLATFRYVLLTAVRDRLIVALLLALAVAVCGALFIAASALGEQNAFGLAFASESTRLILVLGLITFISFHTRQLHETREIEAILARPIARASFVIAAYSAYGTLAVLAALAATAMLGVAFVGSVSGLLAWGASLILEGLIVVAMTLFCAMALSSATGSVLTALGFYLLARMAASFRFIVENHTATFESMAVDDVVHWIIEAIALVLPRIDLYGQSHWLVYGPGGGWGPLTLLAQAAIYVPLLLAATIRDLHVKRF